MGLQIVSDCIYSYQLLRQGRCATEKVTKQIAGIHQYGGKANCTWLPKIPDNAGKEDGSNAARMCLRPQNMRVMLLGDDAFEIDCRSQERSRL